jgi:ATP-dependent DNA ligase
MNCAPSEEEHLANFSPAEWVIEPKWDGIRLMYSVEEDGVRAWTRTGNDQTGKLPYIEEELLEAVPAGTVLDGEVVDLRSDANGVSHKWNNAQSVVGSNQPHIPSNTVPALTFVAFDVVMFRHVDTGAERSAMPFAWYARRELMETMTQGWRGQFCTRTPYWDFDITIHHKLLEMGFEGSVLKRKDSKYYPGERGYGWNKVKPQLDEDVEIIGFYEPTKGSKYDGVAVGGIRFRTDWGYEGRAAGMDDATRKDMYQNPVKYIGATVELAHHGRQKSGALRHPQFKRLRLDKSAAVIAAQHGR